MENLTEEKCSASSVGCCCSKVGSAGFGFAVFGSACWNHFVAESGVGVGVGIVGFAVAGTATAGVVATGTIGIAGVGVTVVVTAVEPDCWDSDCLDCLESLGLIDCWDCSSFAHCCCCC